MMPPFVVFPTNRIAHFVEVSLYLFYLAQQVNLIQVRGNLPADKKELIKHLEYQISNADEASLREYRVNLRHL